MKGRTGLLRLALLALIFAPTGVSAAASPRHHPQVGLILHDHTALRIHPSAGARPLTVLVEETQVVVLGRHADWLHVSIWSSTRGWVRRRDVTFRKPWISVSTYVPPTIHTTIRASSSAPLKVRATTVAPIPLYRRVDGVANGSLPSSTRVSITAWQQDSRGQIWYAIRGWWAPSDNLVFDTPDPARAVSHDRPVWKDASGKGMWLTLGTIADTAPETLVNAAVANGMTHLYLEAAISPLGFHGEKTVPRLMEAAHRRRVAVIAWVFPYLYDVAADVALTRRVASFRTPQGDAFDGIAADLERNVSIRTVRAYSQLTRAYLGHNYLLVGVTFPPQSSPGYPFWDVARQYNVVAPMDYWHQTKTATGLDYGGMRYGSAYGYRYAQDSIMAIEHAANKYVPVAPIGQTFDNFGRLEMGPYAPSPSEIRGFLEGSKHAGAIGVSFFQWMTTTEGEWQALHSFTL